MPRKLNVPGSHRAVFGWVTLYLLALQTPLLLAYLKNIR